MIIDSIQQNNKSGRVLIIGLFLSIMLSGCIGNNSQSATPNRQTNGVSLAQSKLANNAFIFSVGGTYDLMSDHPTNTKTCLKVGNNINNLQLTDPQALLNFGSTIDSSTVQNALGIDFTATFGWGAFATTTSYHYAKSSQDDDFTMNINYAYQYTSKVAFKPGVLTQGNDVLIPEAQNLLISDPVGFRTMCGNSFISEANAGASVLMKISLKFNSHNEKNVFDDSFHAAGGLANILAAIQHNASGMHYNLSISGIQIGGDPQKLNTLFATYGGTIGKDGYPVLECSNGSDANCTNMINQVITYANTISSQLNSINDYNLYSPTVEPWSSIGINPGITNVDPKILQAMSDLSKQFNVDHDRLVFLNNYHHMLQSFNLLSPAMNTELLQLINNYEQVIAVYHNPNNMIGDCYNGYVSTECINIRDNIFKQRNEIFQDNYLNTLLTYLQTHQYSADLRISNNLSTPKMNCAISPISNETFGQYLINCGGKINGSLNTDTAITIKHDTPSNSLTIHNFNYSYPAASDSGVINLSYATTQPLFADSYYPDVWSNTFMVHANGSSLGMDDLVLTRDSY